MTPILTRLRNYLCRRPVFTDLWTMLWADLPGGAPMRDRQRNAREQLALLVSRIELRDARRVLSVLPTLVDDISDMGLAAAGNFIHNASGGDVGDFPVVIQCTSAGHRNTVLNALANNYPALVVETPESTAPGVWFAGDGSEWASETETSWPLVIAYATWLGPQMQRLIEFARDVSLIHGRVEALIAHRESAVEGES